MPEIKKGNNSAKNVSGVTIFNLSKMAGHVLHCTKFREIISNGISYRADTISIRKITKGNNSAKKCRWNDHLKSLHVVWSCFIFLRRFVKLSRTVSKL